MATTRTVASTPQAAYRNHNRPWRRPGAAAYARARIRDIITPPVTVYPAPDELIKDRDVAVADA